MPGIPDIGAMEAANMADKTVSFSLVVQAPPGWFLTLSPTTLSVAQGQVATFTATTTASGGYVSSIALSVTGLPTGVTATITPNPITQAGTATITIPTAALPISPIVGGVAVPLALTLKGTGA